MFADHVTNIFYWESLQAGTCWELLGIGDSGNERALHLHQNIVLGEEQFYSYLLCTFCKHKVELASLKM